MIIPQPATSNKTRKADSDKRSKGNDNGISLDSLFKNVTDYDDYNAFENIFKRTYTSVCSFVQKMVRSHELAEEIVDDVFFSLWKNRKKIRITSSFKSYLLTSVRNRSLDCLRKMKKKQNLALENASTLPSSQSSVLENMECNELQLRIDTAIQLLPKQCRLIFILSREQGLKYREIAEMLSISIKTVDTQMGRALKFLRGEILTSTT